MSILLKMTSSGLAIIGMKEIKFSSKYFQKFYECAIELIKKELAYVCFLSSDETREYRGTLKNQARIVHIEIQQFKKILIFLKK
jgi:glutamyl/glutaminyl-tRNA synthetase